MMRQNWFQGFQIVIRELRHDEEKDGKLKQ